MAMISATMENRDASHETRDIKSTKDANVSPNDGRRRPSLDHLSIGSKGRLLPPW